MKRGITFKRGYKELFDEIKSRVLSARSNAARSLNKELIRMYWDIGRGIAERQRKYRWGNNVVTLLAGDLRATFPGLKGFSERNVWNMRRLYREYKDMPILQQAVAEIPWGHNLLIMEKTADVRERKYYIRTSRELGWSRNVLLTQINAGAYRLSLRSKAHNFPKVLPAHLAEQAERSLKSVYSLDFLGVTRPVLERELERKLVEKVKRFMLELGAGFSFIGDQYRLELDGVEYFIDLLFFNRALKCLIAIELKTGMFRPEYAGKMDFYLHLLNDQVRLKGENPPVGIILCADKSRITVEYALRSARHAVGVAEYRLTQKLPVPLRKFLPSGKEFERRLIDGVKK